MKTLLLPVYLLLFLTPAVTIANENTDNFWEKVNILKSNKQKIEDLEKHARDYMDQYDFENALACANRGLELSVKINSQDNISDFYTILGRICYLKNQWDKGLDYYNKSLAVSKQINNEQYTARAYNNIAFLKYNQSKLNEALQYCNIGLKIYTGIGDKKGIADSYNCYGHIYTQLCEFKVASDYFLKSIKLFNELGSDVLQYDGYVYLAQIYNNLGKHDSSFYYLNKVLESGDQKIDKYTIAFTYSILSIVYSFYGNYSKALEYQLKGLAIYEKIDNKRGIVIGYTNIGQIFELEGDYRNAIKYYKKGLEAVKELKANYGFVLCYNHLGYNYYKLKEYTIAEKYFSQSLPLAKESDLKNEIANTNNMLGLVYFEQKDYEKALNCHLESLNICKKIGYPTGISATYNYLGTYYQNRANYKIAISYYQNALKIDEELKDKVANARELLLLSENHSKLSLYKPAYEYFKRYKIITDSLKSESQAKRITQLEMQYEFDKKQKEQEFVQQQKEQILQAKIKAQKIITFSTITLISLLSFLSFLAFRNYRLKQKSIQKEIELKQVESEKKHEVDQMKLHFFANISHDIRTPLTLIKGPLHQLVDSNEVPARLQKNIELMYRNTNSLQRLVDQILDFQKLDSNVMSLTLNRNDIIAFTKKITASFAYYVENKKCKLDFFSEYRELIIWFDQEKIEMVIYNLLFNAIKFTPEYGIIKLKISADTEKVCITVKDSGVGIPTDHLDLIFERYHQVEKTKAYYKGGSGIGLAHSKELIKLHQGEITVKSTEGEGSEFSVSLSRDKDFYRNDGKIFFQNGNHTSEDSPIKIMKKNVLPENDAMPKNDIIIVSKKDSPMKKKGLNDKPSVLLVEDDLDMHRYIVDCLQPHFQLLQAYNGADGFNLAITNNPNLIISDIMMEGMDGIELCNKIKTEFSVCHIPVILLTALASIESKITGFETGADDYITKPFDANLLRARVQNIIESRKLLREVFSRSIIIEPQKITVNSLDEEFLRKAIQIVEENMSDCNFNVDNLCLKMNVSRSVFFRKIKALTDLPSNDFIKSIRLKRAAQLLKDSDFSISQIAYEVGFDNQKYFSTCFRKYFGKSPSEYALIYTAS